MATIADCLAVIGNSINPLASIPCMRSSTDASSRPNPIFMAASHMDAALMNTSSASVIYLRAWRRALPNLPKTTNRVVYPVGFSWLFSDPFQNRLTNLGEGVYRSLGQFLFFLLKIQVFVLVWLF